MLVKKLVAARAVGHKLGGLLLTLGGRAPAGSQTFLLKPLCGAGWCETSFLLDD